MFDSLMEELNNSLLQHGGELLDVPMPLRECSSLKGDGKIRSWLWNVPNFRRWRVTRLEAGKKLQVLNSVAYPDYANDLPILGIDLLWFENREKLVAVLDFQPLIQDPVYFQRYFSGLKKLKKKFSEFNENINMNIYNPNQYFSPWVLFYKGSFDESDIPLSDVFNSFLNCYWELVNTLPKKTSPLEMERVKKLQISYDKYSADKDPAHSLFTSFFGKEWSDQFLKEFLFPLSSSELPLVD